jgi:hypothetical protein
MKGLTNFFFYGGGEIAFMFELKEDRGMIFHNDPYYVGP